MTRQRRVKPIESHINCALVSRFIPINCIPLSSPMNRVNTVLRHMQMSTNNLDARSVSADAHLRKYLSECQF